MSAALIEEYQAGATALRESVAGMTREQQAAHPIAGKWSTLEVVCHLADMEGVFSERMKRVLAEESPPLPNADENQWASSLAYPARDANEEVALVALLRGQMARILRQLPTDAWQRIGHHSTAGPLTLETIVHKAVAHLEHHRAFILEKRRALGV